MSPTIPRPAERVQMYLVRRASGGLTIATATREHAETSMAYGDRLLCLDTTLNALIDLGAREISTDDVKLQGQPVADTEGL